MHFKNILVTLSCFFVWTSFAQIEQPIRLVDCNQNDLTEVENCFFTTITQAFNDSFKFPENIDNTSYPKDFSMVFINSVNFIDFELPKLKILYP